MVGPNIIVLTIEDHTRAHALLAQANPVLSRTKPEFVAAAHKGGHKTASLKLGIHAPKMLGVGGNSRSAAKLAALRKTYRASVENGKGIFAPGANAEAGRISGRKQAALHLGCHAPGAASRGGLTTGKKSFEMKVGIHAPGVAAKAAHERWRIWRLKKGLQQQL